MPSFTYNFDIGDTVYAYSGESILPGTVVQVEVECLLNEFNETENIVSYFIKYENNLDVTAYKFDSHDVYETLSDALNDLYGAL